MPSNYDDPSMQKQLEASVPLIGMYVALASLACSLAMAADAVHGFRSNKLWLPSKYFSLNATSLTLLGVALKLPVDLTTNMWAATDRLAKISSLALMTTAMANFMPSLGSMSDKDVLINVAALGILVITVIVDVCIQAFETRSFLDERELFPEEIIVMSLMLLLLLVLGSSATMVLSTKRFLEAKYQDNHNEVLSQELSDMGQVTAEKLRDLVKKYWVMAETSSPQFVIARSAACATSGVVCLANALILAEAIVRTGAVHKSFGLTASSYGSSTKWILVTQTVGVTAGTIPTSFRWYTAIRLRCSRAANRSLRDELKVEDYWTRKLKEYQGSALSPSIRHQKCRRLLYGARQFVMEFIIRAQISVVLFNKLVLVISCFMAGPFLKLIEQLEEQQHVDSSIPGDSMVQGVRRKSLRLEREADLPDNTLRRICKEVDKVMRMGRSQKPSSLLQLLQKSCNFRGVAEFDSRQVPSIHPGEPKNCWSLPIVTLTSIATALPDIATSSIDQLVSNVRDGLVFVKVVEKSFYQSEEWKNTRKAADLWLGVDLFRKWQGMDLREISLKSRNSREAIQELADKSKRIVSELETDEEGYSMSSPANWPAEVIAANSMYRISNTILQALDEESALTDGEMFERLSIMIADILAACLTNLTRVITTMCHLNAIEEREKNVHEAALLLGKTEEILEFLGLSCVGAEQAPYIEEWRAAVLVEIETTPDATTPSSSGSTAEIVPA